MGGTLIGHLKSPEVRFVLALKAKISGPPSKGHKSILTPERDNDSTMTTKGVVGSEREFPSDVQSLTKTGDPCYQIR